MSAAQFSRRWFLAAVTYFVIGIGLGVFMGASGNHSMYPVHAHINLLGWASMAIIGVIYRAFPAAAQSRAATWHFWLYQLAAPVLLVAIACIYLGYKEIEPLAGIASVVILVSVLFFWFAIWRARSTSATDEPAYQAVRQPS